MASASKVLAALVAALFLAGAVQANSVSYQFTGDDPGFTVAIDKYNPANGPLTSVTLQLNLQITPIIEVLNCSAPTPMSFEAVFTTGAFNPITNHNDFDNNPVTWTDPFGNSGSANFLMSINKTVTDFGPTDFSGQTVFATPLVTIVPQNDLNTFVGTGTLDLSYTTGGAYNIDVLQLTGPSGSVGYSADREYSGTVTVTYNTIPAPEPASMSLLGLGLAAIFVRRRKQTAE